MRIYANGAEPRIHGPHALPQERVVHRGEQLREATQLLVRDTFVQGDCKHAILGTQMPTMTTLRQVGGREGQGWAVGGLGTSAAEHIRFYNYACRRRR